MSSTWQANNPEKWRAYKVAYYATNKERLREKKREWNEKNKTRINAARKQQSADFYHQNKQRLIANDLLRCAKRRAKARGVEFSITLTDVVVPDVCPLLGLTLQKGEGKQHAASPTLDRLDNTLGYIPGNVWVISHKANVAKSNLTADELVQMGQRLKLALVEGASHG